LSSGGAHGELQAGPARGSSLSPWSPSPSGPAAEAVAMAMAAAAGWRG
jgi:hypothetical protein